MTIRRLLTGALLATAMFTVTSCKYGDLLPADAPLPAALVKMIASNGMGVNSPMLVRLYKEESELEVWKQKTDGTYAYLKTYPICAWSGKLGPKKAEGDRQAPEGFYNVTPAQLNPNSKFHLAINMGYPNAYDQANGRTGSHLMIHGSCSSSGCYAMDDEQVQEIYGLARHSFKGGQRNFQIQAYPFRMTPQNFARHRNSEHFEFWKMLKKGSDYFELTKKPPHVGVCEGRYIFDQSAETVSQLAPNGPCPAESLPEVVVSKHMQDRVKVDEIASTMSESEFATYSSFSYKTGDRITPEAYAIEQHRRPGYDKDGNRIRSGVAGFLNR
ncbi:hypothetical protein DYI37_13230 [Fulvimarina endophytica]|uniref:L,D-TPase catalytic domain-containing protein n=1 Tax=Fulvimarina endophytica TaxID=2293836 RepID=A0A371X102_9HYPH|nr:hypothetical protein DYI37_13230 [Fulvimarina endophytica]